MCDYSQCAKRHDYLCPEYERMGECKVTRCPYPHPKRIIKTNLDLEKIGENFTRKRNVLSLVPETSEPTKILPVPVIDKSFTSNESERTGPQRYFIDTEGEKDVMDVEENSEESSDSLSEEGKGKLNSVLTKIKKMKLNYFQDSNPTQSDNSISDSSSKRKPEDQNDLEQKAVPKRRKLGDLPAFIPLD